MATSQHHYVPKFYLRRFSSQARCINLHNIQRSLTVRQASIKHECAKPDYYRSGQIEDALAEHEGQASIAISALCDGEGDEQINTVRRFIVVQLLRTPRLAKETSVRQGKFQQLFHGLTIDGETMRTVQFDVVAPKDIPVYNLLMSDDLTRTMSDLKPVVVETTTDVFLTSDNPVFKYNQYLEEFQHRGTTGLGQVGIQIFLPLSPRHVLVIYDKDVYDYVRKQTPTETDVEFINGLQVIAAHKNLYFNDRVNSTAIEDLVSKYAHLRQEDPTVLDQFSSDENPQRYLVHSYTQTPNVKLNLSFLRIKRRAARISSSKRLQRPLRSPFRDPTARQGSAPETFSTRVARY